MATVVREATTEDGDAVGRLLDDFNREYGEPTPGPGALAERVRELMASGDSAVLLTGDGPHGLALVRFWRSLWTPNQVAYLAELYVVPDQRGHGLGRALMDAALHLARRRGADYMELNTAESDLAARALYESLGFSCREGRPDGPMNLYYERDL